MTTFIQYIIRRLGLHYGRGNEIREQHLHALLRLDRQILRKKINQEMYDGACLHEQSITRPILPHI